jgi:peptidoglycan/xylan/chitin deacetylase (PgdA/CDA1 family)
MHFNSIDKVASFLPIKLLKTLWSPKVIPLVYHAVGYAKEYPYLENLYSIPTPNQFEKDLEFLLKHYKPISLSELVHYKQTNELPGKGKFFFLSFDDGLKQCKEIIEPILKRKGIPATFFLNTSFIDNKAFLHRFKTVLLARELRKDNNEKLRLKAQEFFGQQFFDENLAAEHVMGLRFPQKDRIDQLAKILEVDVNGALEKYKPYMSKSDIDDLISEGHSVGAHSLNHPEFYLLSEDDQIKQVCSSLDQVEKMFNPKYKVFAFPFTDVGVKNSFFRQIENKCKPDLTFASSGIKMDKEKINIHRISMDDIGLVAENRLKSEFLYYGLKWPLGRNIYKRL